MLRPVLKSLLPRKPNLRNRKRYTALYSAPLTYPALIAEVVFGEPYQTCSKSYGGTRGGRVLYPSCNIRYEVYSFYHIQAQAVAASPKGTYPLSFTLICTDETITLLGRTSCN